jgi:hypothetical protein
MQRIYDTESTKINIMRCYSELRMNFTESFGNGKIRASRIQAERNFLAGFYQCHNYMYDGRCNWYRYMMLV